MDGKLHSTETGFKCILLEFPDSRVDRHMYPFTMITAFQTSCQIIHSDKVTVPNPNIAFLEKVFTKQLCSTSWANFQGWKKLIS